MKQRSRFIVFVVLSLLSATIMWGQATNPTPAPTTPPPNPPPAAPAAPATSGNPTIMLLKQGHTDAVRAKAAEDLGKGGDLSSIPALAEALSDPSSRVRHAVVMALAQYHQAAVLPTLEQATKDLDDGVRVTAIRCLVGHYTGVLPTSGFTGFMKKNWQRAASHFEPNDTKIDPGIAVDPTVITTLIAAMKDSRSSAASHEAAKGLGILMAEAAVPDLVASAHSSDSDLAREALNALAKIKDRDAGPKLVDLLDSPNKDVKRDTCVTVGILRTTEALPKLQGIYQNDPDEKDKVAAMQGLAFLGGKASVPLFTQALGSANKELRQGAAEGLARAADPKSVDDLQKAITAEKDASPKLAMEFALAALGKQDDMDYLVSELSSRMRGDVARSYLIELARNPAELPKLYTYLQSPDAGVRKQLCVILMYSGDQGSLQQLDRLEHDPNSDVAAAALRAKSAIRARLGVAASAAKS